MQEFESNGITVNTYLCIGVADARSNGYYLEFCGQRKEKLYASKQKLSFHTNHFLGCGLNYIGEEEASSCSLLRYKQLKQLNASGARRIEDLLTNDSNLEWPICRKFTRISLHGKRVGTISTIVMNLKQRTIKLSRGNPKHHSFETFPVESMHSKL